jgi:hypothetical protein
VLSQLTSFNPVLPPFLTRTSYTMVMHWSIKTFLILTLPPMQVKPIVKPYTMAQEQQ